MRLPRLSLAGAAARSLWRSARRRRRAPSRRPQPSSSWRRSTANYEDACGVAFDGGECLRLRLLPRRDRRGPSVDRSPDEDPSSGPCKLAFDAAGDLYVNNWHHDVVRFASSELPKATAEVIDSSQPTGLAVDPAPATSMSPTAPTSASTLPRSSRDAPIATIGSGDLAKPSASPSPITPPRRAYLYVADAADNRVKVFDPATSLTTPVEEIDGAATPQGRFTYFVNGELARRQQPRIALLRAPLRARRDRPRHHRRSGDR